MKRRQFIILTGAGAASSTFLSACRHPEEKLVPMFIPDDQYIPGIDVWKASTCHLCDAGCGILVRTRERKANKIEGNPAHPVNRGGICARGQAGLEVLYNPDRIKSPMKRTGERGEGKWQEISWEEAIKTLVDRLAPVGGSDPSPQSLFVTTEANGVTANIATRLAGSLLTEAFVVSSLFDERMTEAGYADSYGGPVVFDLANATYLISFGARFLETWHSPMMYSRAYGEFRSSSGKTRGRFIHLEPRMSLTAANADEWLAAAPGLEHLVALAIANVILKEGLNRTLAPSNFAAAIEAAAPESVSAATGIPAEKLTRLAREFGKAERPLAIGSAQVTEMASINLLNRLMDNVNKKGGVLVRRGPIGSAPPLRVFGTGAPTPLTYAQFPEALRTRSVRALIFHNFNPVFVTPEAREVILGIPFIASFSTMLDETAALADLVLPDHSYLERWDLDSSSGSDGAPIVSLTQPAIEAQLNTRQTADVLLELARAAGGPAATALPFESAKEMVERAVNNLKALGSQAGQGESEEEENSNPLWTEITEHGVLNMTSGSGQEPAAERANSALGATAAAARDARFPGGDGLATRAVSAGKRATAKPLIGHDGPSASQTASTASLPDAGASGVQVSLEFPLTLIIYETLSMGEGQAASLPSLQELPDPMTSVLWGSWLEINPATAQQLNVSDGDLVDVTNERGSVRVPAVLFPGIRPDCVAMPFGQGHESYGRFAGGRGSSPTALMDRNQTAKVGGRSNMLTGVHVTKAGTKGQLIRFGTELMEHMEFKR